MGAALVPLAVHPLQLTPPGADGGPLFRVHGTPGSGIGLVGEIDCWCADQLSVLLAAASGDLHEPVLDISGLRFADVAAIRAIAGRSTSWPGRMAASGFMAPHPPSRRYGG